MTRQPDYISPTGLRIWFEELVYLDSFNGIHKSILIGTNGDLFSHKKKGARHVRFKPYIQEAYIKWKHDKAESFLLGNTDTKPL